MRYTVIETLRDADAVYARFHEQGRMLPEGLVYVDSWLTADRRRCSQLMETEDPALFAAWTARWEDLVCFDVIPLTEPPARA